jgi:epoxyqueuosine reductase
MARQRTAPAADDALGAPAPADRLVRDRARALGFDVVGVASASVDLDVEHARYRAFLDAGRQGEMAYLADRADVRKRLDSPEILPGARSVICVGQRYARHDVASDPPLAQGIARYARGRDYHNVLRKKLRKLATFVRTLGPSVRARTLLDVEPVLERAWAARAGLGFVGKNGLVITPGKGSYLLLGEVVTTLELTPDTPMTERCGSCTRCLDACPTGAFDAPFVLDPRKCIAYLTIEQPAAPPPALREAIGEHLFGCDDCQDVCPFNRTAPGPVEGAAPFAPRPLWGELSLAGLVEFDDGTWEEAVHGSPLRRPGRAGLARNAAIVAANRLAARGEDADARAALLAAERHDDPAVREIAAWARQRAGRKT